MDISLFLGAIQYIAYNVHISNVAINNILLTRTAIFMQIQSQCVLDASLAMMITTRRHSLAGVMCLKQCIS